MRLGRILLIVKQNFHYKSIHTNWAKKIYNRARAFGVIKNESGYVKLVIDKNSEQIIGAQMICPDATNMIGELTVAVQKKMTVSELKEVIHPHPTVVEMIADCL